MQLPLVGNLSGTVSFGKFYVPFVSVSLTNVEQTPKATKTTERTQHFALGLIPTTLFRANVSVQANKRSWAACLCSPFATIAKAASKVASKVKFW